VLPQNFAGSAADSQGSLSNSAASTYLNDIPMEL
jgi:hypothetical protein